jgi:hypothetical protein
MKYIYIILILTILSACSNNISNKKILEIDYKNLQEIPLSDYIKEVKIVRLETSADVLVGTVSKVEIYDNKLFVLDIMTNSIFIFTKDGQFIHQISKIGAGPGEYLQLLDFKVLETGLYLLDYGKSILHYDFNFQYVGQIKCNYPSFSFICDNQYYWFYREPFPNTTENQVIMFNNEGKLVKEFFLRTTDKVNNSYAFSNVFQIQGSIKYFSPRHGNTIYQWNGKNSWDEFITLSFGDKTFHGDIAKLYDHEITNLSSIIRHQYFVLPHLLVIDFLVGDEFVCCFYDTRTMQMKTGKVKDGIFMYYTPKYKSGNSLILTLPPVVLMENHKELCESDNLKGLNADDNPVLVIYEFFQ